MNNKERKGEKKSLYNEGFEICHEICHIIHILTLLVNFTKYQESRCLYQSLLNYVSEQMLLHCILGSIPSIWHSA